MLSITIMMFRFVLATRFSVKLDGLTTKEGEGISKRQSSLSA
ncbi:hypothetical protein L798_13346 [Zootermopsis nevadensis]|uniref:Uncharacterized protein n=1 Tax=Zootermopsis nevadensis TaxID=136037 RepID=A0A067QUG2_ZOONE|nr:hypothetical protein L798_13346 [Zootermopsis nevadensis]